MRHATQAESESDQQAASGREDSEIGARERQVPAALGLRLDRRRAVVAATVATTLLEAGDAVGRTAVGLIARLSAESRGRPNQHCRDARDSNNLLDLRHRTRALLCSVRPGPSMSRPLPPS